MELSLSDIIGILGFLLALGLGIKELATYLTSRAKLEIELLTHFYDLRNISELEKRITMGTGEKLPEKLLFFSVSFYLINTGEKEIGIKHMYLRWANPTSRGIEKHSLYLNDIGTQTLIYDYKKYFILRGGEQVQITLEQEPNNFLQVLLFKKNIFKPETSSLHKNQEYYEKIPKNIVLDIAVIDQKGREIIKKVNFS